ncbi:hypothetical protein SSIN_1511 [Streptococcus sinensis]|uniref:Uncharacterized protein n=1 Tax=Streptococcus sinensis TaxID=176090 RepID=A0A0A0DDG6_9STRE|nr:hypothetical protein SSIN_1511 [Streptococcus sinensis]
MSDSILNQAVLELQGMLVGSAEEWFTKLPQLSERMDLLYQ